MASHQSYFSQPVQIFLCYFHILSCFPCLALLFRHNGRPPLLFHTIKWVLCVNLRTFTLLLQSNFIQIYENVDKEQLVNFLTTHSLIYPSQNGFLKGQPCLFYQIKLLKLDIYSAYSHRLVPIIFLDMSKAFNCICHS